MKFDFEEWKDKNVCMVCKTREEATDFCKKMSEVGLRWRSGLSYEDRSCFIGGGDLSIAYYFNEGTYDYLINLCDDPIVLKWSDYMDKSIQKTPSSPSPQFGRRRRIYLSI